MCPGNALRQLPLHRVLFCVLLLLPINMVSPLLCSVPYTLAEPPYDLLYPPPPPPPHGDNLICITFSSFVYET